MINLATLLIAAVGGLLGGALFGAVSNAFTFKFSNRLAFGTNPFNALLASAALGAFSAVGGALLLAVATAAHVTVPGGLLLPCGFATLAIWAITTLLAPSSNSGFKVSSAIVSLLFGVFAGVTCTVLSLALVAVSLLTSM